MTEIVPKEPRHRWPDEGEPGFVRLHGSDTPDGNDRTEKQCKLCGLWKITVHPVHGLPWREWRTRTGQSWLGTSTPPCRPVKAEAK